MAISAKDVMELRKQTDCGMMECKKALTQADGDFEKAIEILREQGLAAANKKAGRIAAEGMVYAVSFDNCAVVVEVNAETDFVAKNDKFVDFTKNLAKVVADENPADVEALMACKMGDGTVDDALKALILVIKENIKVRRFARYEGHCAAYVHGGGTHGVIVKFETSDDVAAKPEFAAFGKDIAMQVAAANPSYLNESDVPEDVLAKEKEIVAYHEIGHALVAAKQTDSAPVTKITIVPRTSGALGYTMQVDEGEHNLMSKDELLNKVATLTGGRAAEELIFGSITTGASNDIEQATKLTRSMITRYGMSRKFDMVALETVTNQYLSGDTALACSAETAAKIDEEVIATVKTAHEKAIGILQNNMDALHRLAHFLLEK